jgi:hypothetical protein
MIITNLLTNMVVLTFWGTVPTNTPAFQDYALQLVLTNSQVIAAQLQLDQEAIRTNKITYFHAVPRPEGPDATVVFDKRYFFERASSSLRFFDENNSWEAIFSHGMTNKNDPESLMKQTRAVYEQLRHSTNHLTLRKARHIAQAAMRSIGPQANTLVAVRAEQMKHRDEYITHFEADGTVVNVKKRNPKVYPLPYYEFSWETKSKEPYAACHVHVSGIISNVVYVHFVGVRPRLPKPENYLELLGLPPNTVFVKRRLTDPVTYELYRP